MLIPLTILQHQADTLSRSLFVKPVRAFREWASCLIR
jgi:hypothetical protein